MQKLNFFKRFLKKRDGNVALTTGLALPVILMISMGAMDYGLMVQSDQELKAAASAAALAAANEAQIAFNNDENVDLKELMEETATKVFRSRTAKMGSVNLSAVEVVPEQRGSKLTAVLNYTATYKTKVLGFAGQDTIRISAQKRATVSSATYINVAILVDGSASMGIGATTFDQQLMQTNTGCTFACHGYSYNRATALGATMRIDVARQAAADSIHVIKENASTDDQVTVGVYRFGSNIDTLVDFNDPRAADLTFVESEIRDKLYLAPSGMGTDIEGSIERFAAQMPDSGSGRTPDDRIQYLVVLTDGVEDYRHGAAPFSNRNVPWYRGGIWAPGSSRCPAIRARGINIFFIRTQYLTPTFGRHQAYYNWIDANLNPILDDRFADCAGSEDYVFKTSTPQEIQNAFLDVMGDISTPLRLF